MRLMVVTVVGKDKVGIVAGISNVLAKHNVNIVDITQTVLRGFFAMIMIVDVEKSNIGVDELRKKLKEKGKELGVEVNLHSYELIEALNKV